MNVRNIRIEDYDYPLPEERIASHPLPQRDSCKLLVAGRQRAMSHHVFSNLPYLIKRDTLIVANETKVIRARMEFIKASGARIEIFILEPCFPADYVSNFESRKSCSWVCLVGNRKRWKEGPLEKALEMTDTGGKKVTVTLKAELGKELPGNGYEVFFSWDNSHFSFAEIVENAGNIPIPPYLKRKSEDSDTSDYQTVFSKTEGSVAAPTAGLHFTPELITELKQFGDEFVPVTLHVGAGTFQPVKSEEIGDHPMHTEWISVSRFSLMRIVSALENGRDILAVGTTSVRTLESLPYLGEILRRRKKSGEVAAESAPEEKLEVTQWMPYEEEYKNLDTIGALRSLLEYMRENGLDALEAVTSIMIAPGFRWRIVNKLITNFHQPKSTLLLLVSSFLGRDGEERERWRDIYQEALREGYRFLSYGDACLFSRGRQTVMLPASKSMALRAATINAVKSPEKLDELENLDLGDDARYYIAALRKTLASALPDAPSAEVYIGEGAAPLRFLVAFAASLPGSKVRITCAEGLRRRPLRPLVDTLQAMGADIEFNDTEANWSVRIRGKRLRGGEIKVDASVTSQYASALMLASPLWEEGGELEIEEDNMVSAPYLEMTARMMASVLPKVEADWSAAAFFYENCLVSGQDVEISGLTPAGVSLQGDSEIVNIFLPTGVRTHYKTTPEGILTTLMAGPEVKIPPEEDVEFLGSFAEYPDIVPALAVGLCYRKIPFRLKDIGHLRYKESDRLQALQSNLVRIGYGVSIEGDSLIFNGEFHPLNEFPVKIDPYGDHRIAMAFYPLELMGMVEVEDKAVVAKSFPNFYQQFK